MQERKQRKTRRAVLLFVALLAGTAIIGWGGLAAWQAYTENDNNTVTAGTLNHTNKVASVCNSSPSLPMATPCDVIYTANNISPSTADPLATGSVKIDNTGSLNSTFTLTSVTAGSTTLHAGTGNLCGDLDLTVVDANGATVFTGKLSTIVNASLNNNAGTPSATWVGGGTAGTGTGQSGNTFTFTVSKDAALATDNAAAGQSCTDSFLFTQTSA